MVKVSVILPVFNGQTYLHSSISSILKQTLSDFELLVIDDGSTDDSFTIASTFTDPRIRILRHERNLGLPAALNAGIENASAELLARHDQDDIALPDRLAKQFDFLASRCEVGVVGSWARVISEIGKSKPAVVSEHRHPTDDETLRWRLLWNSPFVHSSVMMRSDVVREVGGYSCLSERSLPEDYDLWVRMSRACALANIPQFLQVYRQTSTGMSRVRGRDISRGVTRISRQVLSSSLPGVSEADVEGLSRALNGQPQPAVSLGLAFRRLDLLRRASQAVPGFRIRDHFGVYSYTSLRVFRNSLVTRSDAIS